MKNRQIEIISSHIDLVNELKEIKRRVKVYEIHAERIKKQLIDHYFVNTDSLVDNDGLVISTYKTSIRTSFQTTVFQKDEPVLYEKYLDIKEVKTLLIK